jgi:signal transduction histidine kinase
MNHSKVNLLLIEDSEDDAAVILLHLKRGGFQLNVLRIETEEELREALLKSSWDIIISDYNLPSFNARSALSLVRAQDANLPVIIVSGAIGEEMAAEFMRAGAQDVIMKGHLVRLSPAIDRELTEAKLKKTAQLDRDQALEELRVAVQVRDEFLSIASHELRTPLTPLKMQIQLLQRMVDQSGDYVQIPVSIMKTKLQLIDKSITRLSKLIDNLLDVSRIANQRLSLEIKEIDFSEILKEVLSRFEEQANQMGCTLKSKIETQVTGHWDPFRVEQIVNNILSNAIKYGAKHPVLVELSKNNETATLQITDHGIGISDEDQERIFGRFERATSSSDFGGLGLGLYITKELVEAHGGKVHVQSTLGQGSCFTVVLPRRINIMQQAIQQLKGA